jgi:hypothetical protein
MNICLCNHYAHETSLTISYLFSRKTQVNFNKIIFGISVIILRVRNNFKIQSKNQNMNICLCNHYAHETSLTPPLCFIDVPMQSQEYEWFCMCAKGIDIASFYDFSIGT